MRMVPGAKWVPNGNPREWLTPSPYPDNLTRFLLSGEALRPRGLPCLYLPAMQHVAPLAKLRRAIQALSAQRKA